MKDLDIGITIVGIVLGFIIGIAVAGGAIAGMQQTDRELLVQCVEESNNAGLCFDLLN